MLFFYQKKIDIKLHNMNMSCDMVKIDKNKHTYYAYKKNFMQEKTEKISCAKIDSNFACH